MQLQVSISRRWLLTAAEEAIMYSSSVHGGVEKAVCMRSSSPDSSLMRFAIGDDVAKCKVGADDGSNVSVILLEDSVMLVKKEFKLWETVFANKLL